MAGLKRKLIFSKNSFLVLFIDVVLICLAAYLSCVARFDSAFSPFALSFQKLIPVFVVSKIFLFYCFDLYRGMWRYTGVADLVNVVKASLVSTLLITTLLVFIRGFTGLPRSVFLLDMIFTIFFISCFRIGVRFFFDFLYKSEMSVLFNMDQLILKFKGSDRGLKKLLIIGASDSGERIVKEILKNSLIKYDPVGFLDDDPKKKARLIHGIPVLHSIDHLDTVADMVGADELLIALSGEAIPRMRRVVDICEKSGLPFMIIPDMAELIDQRGLFRAIREVSFSDLLGREPVVLNLAEVELYLKNKRVLVTGAGGSIGSELSRQICRFAPESVILLDRAETPLFEIEYDIKRHFSDTTVFSVLADIQHRDQIKKIFKEVAPDIVFHAAAYKHVVMLERQPERSVLNNIMGTVNVVDAANEYKVDSFVFVSTDKAVRPTSIMGASKRIAEIYVQNRNLMDMSSTKFMTVRFGNVAGSGGSVVPIFKKQIKEGGPVTVTHPEVTRFFMTIPEACQLILQSGAMGKAGEIFVLDMGTPIKIDDMARDMITLYGYKPDIDIKIEYIGLRKGEKLFEEFVLENENVVKTSHKNIMILKGNGRSLERLNGSLAKLEQYAAEYDSEKIKEEFINLVSQYVPSDISGSQYPPN